MQNHINKTEGVLHQMWEGIHTDNEEDYHQSREEDDGDGHEEASKTQDIPRAQMIRHTEEAISERDKEGEEHLSMAGND